MKKAIWFVVLLTVSVGLFLFLYEFLYSHQRVLHRFDGIQKSDILIIYPIASETDHEDLQVFLYEKKENDGAYIGLASVARFEESKLSIGLSDIKPITPNQNQQILQISYLDTDKQYIVGGYINNPEGYRNGILLFENGKRHMLETTVHKEDKLYFMVDLRQEYIITRNNQKQLMAFNVILTNLLH